MRNLRKKLFLPNIHLPIFFRNIVVVACTLSTWYIGNAILGISCDFIV